METCGFCSRQYHPMMRWGRPIKIRKMGGTGHIRHATNIMTVCDDEMCEKLAEEKGLEKLPHLTPKR